MNTAANNLIMNGSMDDIQGSATRTPLQEQRFRKERLAAGYRIFGKFGFDEGVAGHITMRDPIDPETFWVNPMGRSFKQICVSDLIRVSHEVKSSKVRDCLTLLRSLFMAMCIWLDQTSLQRRMRTRYTVKPGHRWPSPWIP